jgi:signal peptidase I
VSMTNKILFWSLALVGGAIAGVGAYFVGDPIYRILFLGERSYIASSPSMTPTFQVGERFLRRPVDKSELQRGDLVTFKVVINGKETMHLKRIAGLGGDTIALIDGVVIVNGAMAKQTKIKTEAGMGLYGQVEYLRLRERFPGEPKAHEIYDERSTSFDNFGPIIVPQNEVFVLGDNRDNSADSRSPPYAPISGTLKVSDITGRVTKIWWSDDSSRRGLAVH